MGLRSGGVPGAEMTFFWACGDDVTRPVALSQAIFLRVEKSYCQV